jgi:hypothetical protein
MRAGPKLPHNSTKSNDSSSLLDAVLEIGNRRRLLLVKMKEAVQKRDREAVFHCAEELVGCVEPGTEGRPPRE